MTRDAAVTSPGTGPASARSAGAADPGRPRMRYTVDGWDPAYGASLELEVYLQESSANVAVDLELPASEWHPIDVRTDIPAPAAMLFVDGVRRIEARVWIDSPGDAGEAASGGDAGEAASGPATDATAALCASYAAGVVCCCGQQAHLVTAELRRGLFSIASHASDINTRAGKYQAHRVAGSTADVPLMARLSQALQRRLADVEVMAAPRPAPPSMNTARPSMMTCSSSTARCAGGSTCRVLSGISSHTAPPTCPLSSTRSSAG